MKRNFTVYMLNSGTGSLMFSRESQAKRLQDTLKVFGYDSVIVREQRTATVYQDQPQAVEASQASN